MHRIKFTAKYGLPGGRFVLTPGVEVGIAEEGADVKSEGKTVGKVLSVKELSVKELEVEVEIDDETYAKIVDRAVRFSIGSAD